MATDVTVPVAVPLPDRLAVLSLFAAAARDAGVPLRDWVPLREAIERLYGSESLAAGVAEPGTAPDAALGTRAVSNAGGRAVPGSETLVQIQPPAASDEIETLAEHLGRLSIEKHVATRVEREAARLAGALAEAVLRIHPADITTPRCEWCAVAELAADILGRPTARARRAG